jgi:homoserine O-acetyltransferase
MRRLIFLLALSISVPSFSQAPAKAPAPERHEFVLHNFKTESGVVLPEAHIVYGTTGTLNADRSNAVLLPSHYMANLTGYQFLVKSDAYAEGALDPSKVFLVTSELFGNGRSSSPSNTPPPFDGPRFPVMTIRDNVNAVHQLLTEELHIQHLRAVIGFSMGAQQAFQWAVSYPTFMDKAVATSGTAKTYGHGVVRLEGQIAALSADPAFMNGDYKAEPEKGLEAFGMVWAGWLYSQEWWRKELWRTTAAPGTTFEQYMFSFRKRFSADANNYILQARTWESNNVGNTTVADGKPTHFNGDVEQALRSIKVPFLYMPSATDLYFPLEDAQYEAAFIPHGTLMPIPSLWGHPAGAGASPADKKFLNEKIAGFLGE